MSIPFVGAQPSEDARPAKEAFLLLESVPSKADKAALQRLTEDKLSFHKRAMRLTLGDADGSAAESFAVEATKVVPVILMLRAIESTRRDRSRAHRDALKTAARLLSTFDDAIASSRSNISKSFAQGLLFELWVEDSRRSFSDAQRALLEPEIERAANHRRWSFEMMLLNERESLLDSLESMTWDSHDAWRFLSKLVDRVSSWGEDVDGVLRDAAIALANRLGDPPDDMATHTRANALWLGFRAALDAEPKLAETLEPRVRAEGRDAKPSLVFGDLRRGGDVPRYLELADELVVHDATRLYDAGCFMVSRSTALALDLFDRACRAPDPPWQAPNNGVAMLLTLYPEEVPPELVEVWRERIAARTEAPARHNFACLLARLGELDAARDALIESIEGGADLDPMAGDAELVAVLDDRRVIAALDARVTDRGERARYEAMRLLALGRNEDAMQALIAAARAGYDPNELKYGDAFEPLHDHPDMKKVRRPPKTKRKA